MKHTCNNTLETSKLSETVSFLKAVSEKNRLEIICFLKGGEKCVCEISEFLGLPQNLISHHLKVLRSAGILKARQDGLQVFYSKDNKKIENMKDYFNSLI